MSAALHLARPTDLDRLTALAVACSRELDKSPGDQDIQELMAPLLDGSPHGCVYLIGPTRAPLGYAILTFGWTTEFGGLEAVLEQLYIRPAVRRRGIASEVLLELPKALAAGGIKAMRLRVERADTTSQNLFQRSGFKPDEAQVHMRKAL